VYADRHDSGTKCSDGTLVSQAQEGVPGKISTGISGLNINVGDRTKRKSVTADRTFVLLCGCCTRK